MEQFGEYLKAQREKKGIRLEEIASITKIHLHSLELLEASKWQALPPEPFLRGFIIAYAKYIGLDPKECLGKYLEMMHPTKAAPGAAATSETQSSPSDPSVSQPPAENAGALIDSSGATPSRQIIAASAALFLIVVVGSLIVVGKRALRHSGTGQEVAETSTTTSTPTERQTSAMASVTPEAKAVTAASPAPTSTPVAATSAAPKASPTPASTAKTSPAPAVPVAAKASPTPNATPAASPTPKPAAHVINVEVQHKSWAKIVIDDKPAKEWIMEEGEKATFEANNKIKLVLGNAAGSTVLHNGEPATGTKYDGTIRYWKFPKGARFAQDKKSAKKSRESGDDDDSSSDE